VLDLVESLVRVQSKFKGTDADADLDADAEFSSSEIYSRKSLSTSSNILHARYEHHFVVASVCERLIADGYLPNLQLR
jgi:hypothetical protein